MTYGQHHQQLLHPYNKYVNKQQNSQALIIIPERLAHITKTKYITVQL